ncbi:MAG: DMT family transporter, partial [Clostridia bacterium]|nr:DMT family transporter [Clostridia bacterium]
LRGGMILGALYFVCMVFEMFGLRLIDTGVSALVGNMAIVLVPLLAALLTRTLPRRKTMFCAMLAVVGVGFLSLTQGERSGGGLGIVLAVLAAVTYAFCILATGKVSRDADPITVGMVQLGVMGALSLAAALVTRSADVPRTGGQWLMMLLLVLLCSCFGFAFQPLGQKYLPAEEAAVLTVVNPFTASVMGIVIAGESMSAFKLIGYVLILTALAVYSVKTENGKS